MSASGDTITITSVPVRNPARLQGSQAGRVCPSIPIARMTVTWADSLEKYKLNDASLFMKRLVRRTWAGFPLRLPGLLHLDIVQERIEREFHLSIILFRAQFATVLHSRTAARSMWTIPHYLDPMRYDKGEEPYIRASMMLLNATSVRS